MNNELDMSLSSDVIIDDELDMALQELDLLFNTERCELIGNVTFGTTFEQLLWTLNPDPNEVKKYIYRAIADATFFNDYSADIDVNVVDGELRPIYYVQIILTYPGTTRKKYRQYEFK